MEIKFKDLWLKREIDDDFKEKLKVVTCKNEQEVIAKFGNINTDTLLEVISQRKVNYPLTIANDEISNPYDPSDQSTFFDNLYIGSGDELSQHDDLQYQWLYKTVSKYFL